MKLLLRESIENLGTIGDTVTVADGFGRNFLIPQGKAMPVSTANLALIEKRKKQMLEDEAKRKADFGKIAAVLADKSFTIRARAAGDEGKLYGSVGAQSVADAIAADGFKVEPRMVLLDAPIKELGIFEVRLRLFPGVETMTKVWVVEDTTAAAIE
ncbi:MAG: 50S ribosomal protein L9 [Planctomycetota bacterium]|jgi:large subunit ribosomal protein L9